jgi:hypothetical protein
VRRRAALAVVPLLLTVAFLGFGGHASAAPRSAQPAPSQTCVLLIFCFPSSPSPSAAPSSPTATPSPSASSSTAARPSNSPSAAPGANPSTGPSSTASPSTTGSPSSTGSPSPTGSSSASPSPTQPKNATAAAGLVVSNVTWTMTVGAATMNGFVYEGNVNLPLAGGGTIQVMEFTVSSMSMSNITTVITENGTTGTETDTGFTASGVTLYATQLTGDIYGIPVPVTFTPTTVLTQLLKITNVATGTILPISMTHLTADQAVILAGQAQKTTVAVTG